MLSKFNSDHFAAHQRTTVRSQLLHNPSSFESSSLFEQPTFSDEDRIDPKYVPHGLFSHLIDYFTKEDSTLGVAVDLAVLADQTSACIQGWWKMFKKACAKAYAEFSRAINSAQCAILLFFQHMGNLLNKGWRKVVTFLQNFWKRIAPDHQAVADLDAIQTLCEEHDDAAVDTALKANVESVSAAYTPQVLGAWCTQLPQLAIAIFSSMSVALGEIVRLCEGPTSPLNKAFSSLASLFKSVTSIPLFMRGYDMIKYAVDMVYHAITGRHCMQGMEFLAEFNKAYADALVLIRETAEVLNPPMSHISRAASIMKILEFTYPHLIHFFPEKTTALRVQFDFVETRLAAHTSVASVSARVKPIAISLFGPAGTFKTVTQIALTQDVFPCIKQYLGDASGDDLPYYAEHAANTTSLSLNCCGEKNAFDEGYLGNTFYCFEELYSCKSADLKAEWSTYFFRCIDGQPMMMNMAFKLKGKVYMQSPFVVATGNGEHSVPLEDPTAYFRRIEFDIVPMVSKEYVSGTKPDPAVYCKYKFSENCRKTHLGDLAPTQVIRTHYKEFLVEGATFTYPQLVQMIAAVYIDRISMVADGESKMSSYVADEMLIPAKPLRRRTTMFRTPGEPFLNVQPRSDIVEGFPDVSDVPSVSLTQLEELASSKSTSSVSDSGDYMILHSGVVPRNEDAIFTKRFNQETLDMYTFYIDKPMFWACMDNRDLHKTVYDLYYRAMDCLQPKYLAAIARCRKQIPPANAFAEYNNITRFWPLNTRMAEDARDLKLYYKKASAVIMHLCCSLGRCMASLDANAKSKHVANFDNLSLQAGPYTELQLRSLQGLCPNFGGTLRVCGYDAKRLIFQNTSKAIEQAKRSRQNKNFVRNGTRNTTMARVINAKCAGTGKSPQPLPRAPRSHVSAVSIRSSEKMKSKDSTQRVKAARDAKYELQCGLSSGLAQKIINFYAVCPVLHPHAIEHLRQAAPAAYVAAGFRRFFRRSTLADYDLKRPTSITDVATWIKTLMEVCSIMDTNYTKQVLIARCSYAMQQTKAGHELVDSINPGAFELMRVYLNSYSIAFRPQALLYALFMIRDEDEDSVMHARRAMRDNEFAVEAFHSFKIPDTEASTSAYLECLTFMLSIIASHKDLSSDQRATFFLEALHSSNERAAVCPAYSSYLGVYAWSLVSGLISFGVLFALSYIINYFVGKHAASKLTPDTLQLVQDAGCIVLPQSNRDETDMNSRAFRPVMAMAEQRATPSPVILHSGHQVKIFDKVMKNMYTVANDYGSVAGTLTFFGGQMAFMNAHVWDSLLTPTITLASYLPGTTSQFSRFSKSEVRVVKRYDPLTDVIILAFEKARPHANILSMFRAADDMKRRQTYVEAGILAMNNDPTDFKGYPEFVSDPITNTRLVNANSGGRVPMMVASSLSYQWSGAAPGKCGALLFNCSNQTFKIIGMHVAGASPYALAVPIHREMLEGHFLTDMSDKHVILNSGLSSCEYLDRDPAGFYDMTGDIITTPHHSDPTGATMFCPTEFTELRFGGGSPVRPASLGSDAYKNALAKEVQTLGVFSPHGCVSAIVAENAEHMADFILPMPRNAYAGCRRLTIDEALGDDKRLTAFDVKSSRGARLKAWGLDKGKLVRNEGDERQALAEHMRPYRDCHDSYKFTYQICFDKLKDETRDNARVDARKTRLFNITDFVDKLLIKQYIGDLVAKTKCLFQDSLASCGVNPGSNMWQRYYSEFVGHDIVFTDVSGFDNTVTPLFWKVIMVIIGRAYTNPRDYLCALWAVQSCIFSLRFAYGKGRANYKGNSSGNWITTWLNTIINACYFSVATIVMVKNVDPDARTIDIFRQLRLKLYSDDNLVCNLNYPQIKTSHYAAAFMILYGVTLTGTDKGAVGEDVSQGIGDAEFLSRGFRYAGGIVHCPLSRSSLLSQLYYVRVPKALRCDPTYRYTQLQINLDNVARELIEWEPEAALSLVDEILTFLSENNLPYKFDVSKVASARAIKLSNY